MLFNCLKYITPVWYFNLKPAKDFNYFPNQDLLQKERIDLEPDKSYISELAMQRDIGYRAFQLGYISRNIDDTGVFNVWEAAQIPPEDEYRFLNKNFSKIWSIYTLIWRLLSWHNPLTELKGFVKNWKVKRQGYHINPIVYAEYEDFRSELISSQPLISIVIPTLNRYKYLKDVFSNLENQTYSNFEVIVVDQTDPFDESVYTGWDLDLKYWYQKEKALWKARNDAIKFAKGEYILMYDDDSLIEPDWIEQHLKTLDFFKADISSGVSLSAVGDKIPKHYSYFRWSDQLDTGNALIKKEIFKNIGYFDTKFEKQRMGDGEFGLRAYLAGYRNVSNPLAKRIHLKVGSGGLRQMGSWDGWRPKKFLSPRPIPSILYLFRKYHGNQAALWALLKNIPPSIVPYRLKSNKTLKLLGIVVSILITPIIIAQVYLSWTKSTEMLKS